jgi:hypothetical protein
VRAECGKCGTTATIQVTGRIRFTYTQRDFHRCLIVRERMRANGGSTSDADCDHMVKAVTAERDRVVGRL